MDVGLAMGNTWTEVQSIDPEMMRVIEYELQYPTATAELLSRSWVDPEAQGPGWDGWVRLLRKPKTRPPYFPAGLTDMVVRLCRKFRRQVTVQDLRVRPEEGMPQLGAGVIELRDYQIEAVQAAVRVGHGVLDMPPRSGKTRTMVEIHRQISLPTLWIAPTDRIVVQTQAVLESFFGPNYSVHLVGSAGQGEAAHRQVVVCTAATAAHLGADFYRSRHMICVDEWHHSASKSYRSIFRLCDHIFYRYGMTGTHFRSGTDDLEMYGLLSNTVYRVDAADLLRRGYLVPTRVVFVPVLSKKLRGVPKSFVGGHGKYGIHEHDDRNELVAQAASILERLGRKVLILVGTKAQGYRIRSLIRERVRSTEGAEFEAVEFVSTDTARPRQGRILKAYLESDEVRILIGTSLLGEGVDLPSADALVYARGERAEVSHIQNAYRVGTAVAGKRSAVIVDFADRHHRKLLEHSHGRLNTYCEERTFDVAVLDSIQQLHEWSCHALGPSGVIPVDGSVVDP